MVIAQRTTRAFTLVELLVVIGIIGLLLGLLLPTLTRARVQARQAVCLSNLRQLMTAAGAYADDYAGRLPVSQWSVPNVAAHAWDFSRVRDPADGQWRLVPGLLWRPAGLTDPSAVQQCPEFDGKSNSPGDPFTGYNYNTSYLGGGQGEWRPEPAKLTWVADPAGTAVFGDGEYAAGANKFMRAPRHGGRDGASPARPAGTQGFRHAGNTTNLAFADGHAAGWRDRFTLYDAGPLNAPQERDLAPPEGRPYGFLALDNSPYDLGDRAP